jgi:homoaconitase/3-isopropylmalate dehydratase large subunit
MKQLELVLIRLSIIINRATVISHVSHTGGGRTHGAQTEFAVGLGCSDSSFSVNMADS